MHQNIISCNQYYKESTTGFISLIYVSVAAAGSSRENDSLENQIVIICRSTTCFFFEKIFSIESSFNRRLRLNYISNFYFRSTRIKKETKSYIFYSGWNSGSKFSNNCKYQNSANLVAFTYVSNGEIQKIESYILGVFPCL